jgi:hypothetical protein
MTKSHVDEPSRASVRPPHRFVRIPCALASRLALPVLLTLSCRGPDHELENARLALDCAMSQRSELQRRLDVAVARAYHLENQLEALRAQLGMTAAPALHDARPTTAESRRKRW